MKIIEIKKNSNLTADGKVFKFKDGVCQIKKITKDIKFYIDLGYVKQEGSK